MKSPVYDANWSDEVKALYRHDMEEMWDPNITPQVWNLYHDQLNAYVSLAGSPPSDVLDVGCAQGTLALTLAEAGHRVRALDIRPHFLKYAKSRFTHGDIEFICGNALEIELDQKFDTVFANQILEHLVYPVDFVQKMIKFLKPGGTLVMTTPNGKYLRSSLPGFKELGDPRDWEHMEFTADGGDHFFAYTPDELRDVVLAAGLKNIVVTWFESPWISGHMKLRYLHGLLPLKALQVMDRICIKIPLIGMKLSHQLLVTGTRRC